MNKNNAALAIVGFAALIVGLVVGFLLFGPGKPSVDQPAHYVLAFGEPNGSTMVTADLTGLQNALADPPPNWSTLQEVPSEGATPTPVPVPPVVGATPGTLLISKIQIIQNRRDNGQCTMHVTQKVGLNNSDQVRRVLATLRPEATPWPPGAK